MQQYDVIIVGGGIVGLSLALVLGQLNYQVLILDKNPKIMNNPKLASDYINQRTLAISYSSQRIYELLKLWPALSSAVPIDKVWVSMQGQLGSSSLTAQQQGIPALGYVVGAVQLEQVLLQALKALPNVCLKAPVSLASYDIHPTECVVRDDSNTRYVAQLLVAADGFDSALRAQQGIDYTETDYDQVAVMTNVTIPGINNTAWERFLPHGAIALLPWQEDTATCVWTVKSAYAASLMQLSDAAFLRICQEQLGRRLGQLQACSARISYPLKQRLAHYETGTRFLLMGSAAHHLHPIAAQGLNLSLRDIWQLRQQLLQSPSKIDMGSQDFLGEYLHARCHNKHKIIFFTNKVAHWMADDALPSCLRALGLCFVEQLGPVKNYITRMNMGIN